ncbi:MAG: ShlB/FhaC/HecB family hemolysin secretion/activation protein, partial [Flavobacterium sp.]
LYWKSDGQDQKTFDLNIETPFIFKSPLGLKAQLNIFKQDSIYQNTKTAIDLGYYFHYNKKIFLGYQSTESSDTQNTNTASLTDYNNAFLTTEFEFSDFKADDFLFPEKTFLDIKIGTGKRETNTFSDQQLFGSLLFKHNFYLNKKNIIHLKTQNFYLQSNHYIINELERFGGINSIRGFNENSLQGNLFSSLQNEYRYLLTPNLYVHSIIDYGFIQDKTSDYQSNLLGAGFGFGLQTNNGLFNIVYANGSTGNQSAKLSNSVIHISFKANF